MLLLFTKCIFVRFPESNINIGIEDAGLKPELENHPDRKWL